MKRFLLKFLSIKNWFVFYLCYLIFFELSRDKQDAVIIGIFIAAIMAALGIREFSKMGMVKNDK